MRESWRRRGERCGVTIDHHAPDYHTAPHDPSDDDAAPHDPSDVSPHRRPGGRHHAGGWGDSVAG